MCPVSLVDLVIIVSRALCAVPVLVLSPHLVCALCWWLALVVAPYSRSQLAMPSVLLFVGSDRWSDTLGGPCVSSCGYRPGGCLPVLCGMRVTLLPVIRVLRSSVIVDGVGVVPAACTCIKSFAPRTAVLCAVESGSWLCALYILFDWL